MKPKFKPPGTKRLKLKIGILLSTSAFKFNLSRYIKEPARSASAPRRSASSPRRSTSSPRTSVTKASTPKKLTVAAASSSLRPKPRAKK